MKKTMQGSRIRNARRYLLNLVVLAALAGMGLANWNAILYAQEKVELPGKWSQEGAHSELKTVPLGGGIYMFSGDGGNVVAVVDDAETLLIDSGLESRVSELYQAIVQASHRPVTELVNTSGNIERAGGDAFFAAAGVTVIEQENAEKQLSSEDLTFTSIPGESDLGAGPIRSIYVDNMILHQGSENLRLVHYGPGDSGGDTVIYFDKANVVVMGNIFCNGSYPSIDLASGGSVGGIIKTVDRVLAATNDKTRIIPGFGSIDTRADLLAYRRMLVTVRRRIQSLVSKGETKDQVVAEKPTKDFDAQWGTGAVRGDEFTAVICGQTVARSNPTPLSSAFR
jgi:cyclase